MKKISWLRKFESAFIIIFAFFYWYTTKQIFLVASFCLFFLFIFFDFYYSLSKGKSLLARIFFKLYPHKEEEVNRIISDPSLFFASIIAMTLLFSKEIVVLSTILLFSVDAFEQIFGISFKGKSLPWNKNKTYIGTFTGFVAGIFFGFFSIYLLKMTIPYSIMIIASFAAAIGGTSSKFDNTLIHWLSALAIFSSYSVYLG